MQFEWDEAKHASTRRQRGFGFDFAIRIFAGRVLEAVDDRLAYGELRVQALGEADGFVLMVVYTPRGAVRRIISATLANRKERARWQRGA